MPHRFWNPSWPADARRALEREEQALPACQRSSHRLRGPSLIPIGAVHRTGGALVLCHAARGRQRALQPVSDCVPPLTPYSGMECIPGHPSSKSAPHPIGLLPGLRGIGRYGVVSERSF